MQARGGSCATLPRGATRRRRRARRLRPNVADRLVLACSDCPTSKPSRRRPPRPAGHRPGDRRGPRCAGRRGPPGPRRRDRAAERRRDKLTSPPGGDPDPRRLESDGVAPSCSRASSRSTSTTSTSSCRRGFGRDLNAAGRGGGIHRLRLERAPPSGTPRGRLRPRPARSVHSRRVYEVPVPRTFTVARGCGRVVTRAWRRESRSLGRQGR